MGITIRQVGLDALLERGITKTVEGFLEFFEQFKNENHNIILQISVRISGTNILYIDNMEEIHNISTLFKMILIIFQKGGLALGAVPLDSVVQIPTFNGFPMIVHLNNTMVNTFKDNFRFNVYPTKTRKLQMNYSLQNKLSSGLNLKVGNYKPGFEYYMRFSFHPVIDALIEYDIPMTRDLGKFHKK